MTRLCHTAKFRDPRQQPAPKSKQYSCPCWEAQVKDDGKAAFREPKPSPVMALGQAVVTHRWVGASHRICSVAQHCVLWPCIRSGLQKRNPTPSRRTLGGRTVSSTGETLFHFTITLKEVVVRWESGFSTKHHVIKLCYHPSLILLARDLPLSSPSSLAVYLPLQAIWEPSCNFPSSSPSL